MRRQIAPHLRNAALGNGPRHAATGSAQETGAPARPTGLIATLSHCDGTPKPEEKKMISWSPEPCPHNPFKKDDQL
jgi:hypothetical protein